MRVEYFCDLCDYKCCTIYSYNRHLMTLKHKNKGNPNVNTHSKSVDFFCERCDFKCSNKYDYNKKNDIDLATEVFEHNDNIDKTYGIKEYNDNIWLDDPKIGWIERIDQSDKSIYKQTNKQIKDYH